jgi:hypothetical protein
VSVRPQIPEIEGVKDPALVKLLSPFKAILEIITGRAPNRPQLKKLGPDATLAGTINKVNEIITRLQE